jgi:hypothetical protein
MVSFAEMFSYGDAEVAYAQWAKVSPKPALAAWPFPNNRITNNPLAAMCHYRDSHSTERLPEPKSTAKPAPAGIGYVRVIGDRSKIGA